MIASALPIDEAVGGVPPRPARSRRAPESAPRTAPSRRTTSAARASGRRRPPGRGDRPLERVRRLLPAADRRMDECDHAATPWPEHAGASSCSSSGIRRSVSCCTSMRQLVEVVEGVMRDEQAGEDRVGLEGLRSRDRPRRRRPRRGVPARRRTHRSPAAPHRGREAARAARREPSGSRSAERRSRLAAAAMSPRPKARRPAGARCPAARRPSSRPSSSSGARSSR